MLTCRGQQAAAYKGSRKINRPATHPIHFAADSPRQNPSLRCLGGIFLYGKRTLKIS